MTPGAPIKLSEAHAKALVDLVVGELDRALIEHDEKEQRLQRWDQLYQAQPATARKTFPWDGACNVVLPLIGTTVDSIVARIVNTIFSVDPFWTVRPLHKAMVPVAKPTEDFLDWSRRVEFNLYKPVKSWTIETTKYGWGWLKARWEHSQYPYFVPTADGKAKREIKTIRRPVVDHILNQDVISQAGIADESQADWIAHRVRLTDGQLQWKVADGTYPISEKELTDILARKEDLTQAMEALAASPDAPQGTHQRLNTIFEVWGDFPVAPGELPVPVCLTVHKPTRTILRAIYNPHYYGFRPFIKGTFIEREGRAEGLGICAMLEHLQDEISTIHCQQVDNATLANTRFFLGKRGVIRPGTKIWPGRVLTVGDPERDLKGFQLGDTYNSMRALEMSIMAFAERRSGVSDPQLGREASSSSRATATGTLALIQEGNRRFDLNVRDMRDSLSVLGKTILQLNQQFRPKGIAYFVQGEDGALTEATLDLPSDYIEQRLGVELTASTATINREVEKQGLIALSQLQDAYGNSVVQLAQIAMNDQLPGAMRELAVKVAQAKYELHTRIMHSFDQKDPENLVPVLEAANALQVGLVPPGAEFVAGHGDPGAVGPGAPGDAGAGIVDGPMGQAANGFGGPVAGSA